MKIARPLTLVVPYYRNPGMLVAQQALWASYPADLRQHFHVIVVDDGSPKYKAEGSFAPVDLASYRLYKILVDCRWNWLACRNLGMAEASTDWVLMTDIDHLLPVETLRRLIYGKLDERNVYRFSRVDAVPGIFDAPIDLASLPTYKPHPNTWLMTRAMFDQIGGYDERFSGFYGTDGEFRDRVSVNAAAIVLLPDPMIRVPREILPDASTTSYGRKEPQDRENVSRIRTARANLPEWRPLRGTFKWARVQ